MATIAAAAIAAGSAYYGAQQTKKAGQRATKPAQALVNEQVDISRLMRPYGERYLREGDEMMTPVTRYYRALLSGDRSAMAGAMAPEIGQINRSSRQRLNTMAELAPRGGGRAAMLAAEPYRRGDQITSLLAGARGNAVGAMGALAGNRSSMGAGMLGSALGGLQGAGSQQLSLGQMMMLNRGQVNQDYGEMGASMADILQAFGKGSTARTT